MNGVEQRQRHTAVKQLATEVDSALDQFQREVIAKFIHERKRTDEEFARESKARNDLARDQRGYVDSEDRKLRDDCLWVSNRQRAFESRGFWSRLNWLFTGR